MDFKKSREKIEFGKIQKNVNSYHFDGIFGTEEAFRNVSLSYIDAKSEKKQTHSVKIIKKVSSYNIASEASDFKTRKI